MADVAPTEPTDMDTLLKGLWRENPVFVQMLGLCPVLAVTNTVINSLVMAVATTYVLVLSSVAVSTFRKVIPRPVRIATYVLIIATFVTMADYIIPVFSLEVHQALGPYVPLIVVNCIILGRAEGFASKNTVGKAALDALGMSAGFAVAVLALGVVRELLGSGTLLGIPVFGPGFEPWVIMILPSGAFFVLGTWLLLFNSVREWKKKHAARRAKMLES